MKVSYCLFVFSQPFFSLSSFVINRKETETHLEQLEDYFSNVKE